MVSLAKHPPRFFSFKFMSVFSQPCTAQTPLMVSSSSRPLHSFFSFSFSPFPPPVALGAVTSFGFRGISFPNPNLPFVFLLPPVRQNCESKHPFFFPPFLYRLVQPPGKMGPRIFHFLPNREWGSVCKNHLLHFSFTEIWNLDFFEHWHRLEPWVLPSLKLFAPFHFCVSPM